MTKPSHRRRWIAPFVWAICLAICATACGGGGHGGGHGGAGGLVGGGGAAGGAGGAGGVSGDLGGAGGTVEPFADCVWDLGSGTTQAGPPPTGDNSADLSGAVLGDIAFDPATMRKAVPVQVTTALTGFVVGPLAYVTRTDPTTELASLTIPVTNGSFETRCFIRAQPLLWQDGLGQSIVEPSTNVYVAGSVAMTTATGVSTDTCLGPMETGYFLDVRSPSGAGSLYTSVVSIGLTMDSQTTGTTTAGHLRPYQYDVGHCPASDPTAPPVRSLRVHGRNDGQGTILLANDGASLGPVVLLDDEGAPAGWSYVSRPVLTSLGPGQTTQLVGSLPTSFSVTRGRFFLSFDGASP